MTLNQDVVRTRCAEITESIARLEKIPAAMTRQAFLADQDIQDIAAYRLLVAIEASLALCYHISAKQLKKVPEEYAECFRILAGAGVIPSDLSERLQRTARFRNLLVHMYWKVDQGAVYDVLVGSLRDISEFAGIAASMV